MVNKMLFLFLGIALGSVLSSFYYLSPRDISKDFELLEKKYVLSQYPWLEKCHGGTVKNMALFVSADGKNAVFFQKDESYPIVIFERNENDNSVLSIVDSDDKIITLKLNMENSFSTIGYGFKKNEDYYDFIDKQADGSFDLMIKNAKDIYRTEGATWVSVK